jgi:uncharacterized protein
MQASGMCVPRNSPDGFVHYFSMPYIAPVALLFLSNCFMISAWYWHLLYKGKALWLVVLISWAIAFCEYCLAVPANRFGSAVYSAAELKIIQEIITLVVFAGFSVLYLRESFTMNHLTGFALMAIGAAFVFKA